MAGTSIVKFNTVEIHGPAGPTDYEQLPRTVSDRTAGLTRYSYQLTSKKVRVWSMRLVNLTQTQKDNFVTFFNDTAVGPSNTFSYTHTDGTVYSDVRFANNELRIERTDPEHYAVDIELELEASIS